jgi:pimeloyl-ACP methyl ester carboxylesterase
LVVALVAMWTELPVLGAGGLLHPARHRISTPPPEHCVDATFAGLHVSLRGWRCVTTSPRRHGTIVYLHGIADNRGSAAGAIARFLPLGYDLIAYDGRAHGDSDGEACTYGFFEKRDLHRVIDTIGGPVVLIGASLGAAVALQEAADDSRVTAIVAAETFSDLRTVATERAPWFFTTERINRAFELAHLQAEFDIDAVSPVRDAARITAPVLLIHGDADVDTPPANSQRVFNALTGPKQLILVPGATHNGSLRPDVWSAVETWLTASSR